MAVLVPLSELPPTRLVESPRLSAPTRAVIDAIHADLLAGPGGYDGDTMLCLEIGTEALLYAAPYSHYLAWRRHPETRAEIGAGPANVRVVIHDAAREETLWAQRALNLLNGGVWSWSASGAIDPGEEPKQAIIREAREEIGATIEDLQPAALLEGIGFCSIYLARLVAGEVPVPDPREVMALHWSRNPLVLAPLSENVALAWPYLATLLGRST